MRRAALALGAALIVFFAFAAARADQDAAALPAYELNVALDMKAGSLEGSMRLTMPADGLRRELHADGMTILSITVDERQLKPKGTQRIMLEPGSLVEIKYRLGSMQATDAEPGNPGVVPSAITEQGASLTGLWYPRVSGMGLYKVRAFVPAGYQAVSEAESVTTIDADGGGSWHVFDFPHPMPAATLVAGMWDVYESRSGSTDLYAYFSPGRPELAARYLSKSARYIAMYEEMVGPFPYKRFSVVENFLPTGYSMPTFTLIGGSVINLPFILDTSLGHEILHQWFGSSVYVSDAGGNWSEGLVAYLADHHYEELEGKGFSHRKKLLLDYANYVKPDKETALSQFMQRTDYATRSIGYGKSAMLFHMLRGELGQEEFKLGLSKFYARMAYESATWTDLQGAFEEASGVELGWFFDQWVSRKGLPAMSFEEVHPLVLGGRDRVGLLIRQHGAPYKYDLRLGVLGADGLTTMHTVRVEKEVEYFELEAGARPVELVVDPDYDLMRPLAEAESPPLVSMITGASRGVVVEQGADKYKALVDVFVRQGFTNKPASEFKLSDAKGGAVVVLGAHNPALKRLYGRTFGGVGEGQMGLEVLRSPFDSGSAIAVIDAWDAKEAEAAAHKLSHYGGYGRLLFSGGRLEVKSDSESHRGLRIGVTIPVSGIRPRDALGLIDIITDVAKKDIIYVGEAHTDYGDHRIQLEFIRTLHAMGVDFAIGMEMFQRPYQDKLDRYIKGELTEEKMLEETEYFGRWRFNWNLYREIVDFARTYGIDVIALNQKSEIVKKVAAGGIELLDAGEIANIPAETDFSDSAYSERLRKVFGEHGNSSSFMNFYQAQVLWDETMALSIAEYMERHPGRKMVVIAGQGHTEMLSGIPRRVFRRNALPYSVIVHAQEPELKPEVADYVLFAPEISPPSEMLLGVSVKDGEQGLGVLDVATGSAAERAGIQKGDLITEAGGRALKKVDDLKLSLLGMKPGMSMQVRLSRPRFLLSPRNMELTVEFR